METRREFFSRFISTEEPLDNQELSEVTPVNPQSLTRRIVLQSTALATIGILAAKSLPRPAEAASAAPIEQPSIPTTDEIPVEENLVFFDNPLSTGLTDFAYACVASTQSIREHATKAADDIRSTFELEPESYADTAAQTVALLGFDLFTVGVLESLGIKQGNSGFDREKFNQRMREDFLKVFVDGAIIVPIIEEGIFRGLPAGIIYAHDKLRHTQTGICWPIGVTQAALFGLIHNFSSSKGGTNFVGSLATPQINTGLANWHYTRDPEKGFDHAVVAHGVINGIAILVSKLLSYSTE